jgi:hypothetical protein
LLYLGEAELVPDPDDRVLELEIVTKLAARCAEAERRLALALEAFPCDLQQQLDQFMSGRCAGYPPYYFTCLQSDDENRWNFSSVEMTLAVHCDFILWFIQEISVCVEMNSDLSNFPSLGLLIRPPY